MTLAPHRPPALLPLCNQTVPRRRLPIRVLQVGAGGFLRGFVDWMVQTGNDAGVLDHGVAVMKVTTRREDVTTRLAEQDGLFHVVLEGVRDGVPFTEITLVTAVQEVVSAHDDWERCRQWARTEELRFVVSNTTEAGITYVPAGQLRQSPPASFPAKMTALLHERWRHFDGDPGKGLWFLPCELIEDNGSTLRAHVLRHAAEAGLEQEFLEWVATACRFSDTLVDRIVTGAPQGEADDLRARAGFDDGLIVKGEHYANWVIAGDPAIRDEFPLHRAGLPVEFVADIRAYRDRKVRILNGSHTALAAVGPLFGCGTVIEACRHPLVGAYLRRLVEDEVLASLDPGDAQFAQTTLDRFQNPALEHRLADIALNALSKWRTRNLPVVLDGWRAGRDVPLSLFALACLLLAYAGAVEVVPVRDDEKLVHRIKSSFDAEDLSGWLAQTLSALGWAGAISAHDAERLICETALHARHIVADSPAAALATLLDHPPGAA